MLNRKICALGALVTLCFTVNSAIAQEKASGCDNLNGVNVTQNVDFQSQIQPIFDQNCANCHTNGGNNGGLKLDSGQSFNNLVNVSALNAPALNRVTPSNLSTSFLFQKVNCNQPDGGSRMPLGGQLSAANQAMIRDWINQGALESAAQNSSPSANNDSATTAHGESISINVLANDSDSDGDSLTITAVGNPANGTAVTSNGNILYTPDLGFSGEDTFSYTISDGNQGQDSATVSVSVEEPLFDMNFGLTGSWFNELTPGQGFAFEIVPSQNVAVVYWYTFDPANPGQLIWLIGSAPYSGNHAEITLFEVDNGVFDNNQTVGSTAWGSFSLTFDSCTTGHVVFNSDLDNVTGSFDIIRITADPMCQDILDAEAAL
ncbi:MAG: Ig-like domain-containing protein [bacterium]